MRPRQWSWLAWPMLALGLAACLGTAYGAYTLAGYSWGQVVGYKSPYVRPLESPDATLSAIYVPDELKPSPPNPGPALSGRVVLVVVDGMREDISRSAMPGLNTLRGYGSDLTLTVPQPSLSFPNWTTILTGAPQTISGVTTNWYTGRVLAPTLMDAARDAGRRVAVVGPTDFAELYGVGPGPGVSLRPWPKGGYLSGTLVDDALRIAKATDPQLLVLHLPDLDEAGHAYGGASSHYREVAAKIDVDVARLVSGLQRADTTFVVVADHGHIDTGGHGGWEGSVVNVPGIFAGASATLGVGTGRLEQVAPTIAVLEGMRAPAYASDTALRSVLATTSAAVFAADVAHHEAFQGRYTDTVLGHSFSKLDLPSAMIGRAVSADEVAAFVTERRLATERMQRAPYSLVIVGIVLAVLCVVGFTSWQALVSALAGTAVYYALYNGLFFWVHGFNWSLSAFNTETHVTAFMNGRMVETVVAGLVGVTVAALVYPFLRSAPKGPQVRGYLGGWLALAPATVLAIQGTLAVQVAWYLWWYGARVSWIIPDLKWGFKADLDMIQMTALGAVALLAPVVTYLIGRYHPRVRGGRRPTDGSPLKDIHRGDPPFGRLPA